MYSCTQIYVLYVSGALIFHTLLLYFPSHYATVHRLCYHLCSPRQSCHPSRSSSSTLCPSLAETCSAHDKVAPQTSLAIHDHWWPRIKVHMDATRVNLRLGFATVLCRGSKSNDQALVIPVTTCRAGSSTLSGGPSNLNTNAIMLPVKNLIKRINYT